MGECHACPKATRSAPTSTGRIEMISFVTMSDLSCDEINIFCFVHSSFGVDAFVEKCCGVVLWRGILPSLLTKLKHSFKMNRGCAATRGKERLAVCGNNNKHTNPIKQTPAAAAAVALGKERESGCHLQFHPSPVSASWFYSLFSLTFGFPFQAHSPQIIHSFKLSHQSHRVVVSCIFHLQSWIQSHQPLLILILFSSSSTSSLSSHSL